MYVSIAFLTFIHIYCDIYPRVSNYCHFPNESDFKLYSKHVLAQYIRELNVWGWPEPNKITTCLCLVSGQQLKEVRGLPNKNNIKTRIYSCDNSHNSSKLG